MDPVAVLSKGRRRSIAKYDDVIPDLEEDCGEEQIRPEEG